MRKEHSVRKIYESFTRAFSSVNGIKDVERRFMRHWSRISRVKDEQQRHCLIFCLQHNARCAYLWEEAWEKIFHAK